MTAVQDMRRTLLDHRVGELLKMQRHVEPTRLRALEIDHQLELDRGLDRKLARSRPSQNVIGIDRRKPKLIALLCSI